MDLSYSVIVPVYRGEATLSSLFLECKDVFEAHQLDYEVVFVYDGGRDGSWGVIQSLKKEYGDRVKGIRLTRNYGQHNALLCGFRHARGDLFITMDEDLQHSAKDIPALIKRRQEGDFDVVYGVYREKMHNPFRNISSNLLRKMISTSIPDIHPDYSAYRLIKAGIARKTLSMKNSYTFVDGYLSWVSAHMGSVYVNHSAGKAGKSSYTFAKLLDHSINIFVTFSNVPIRLLTAFSFLLFALSGGYGLYMLLRKILYNDLISGFASFAVMGGFGLGFLLLGMGILGEYVYRINLKTTQRPVFEERDIL